MADRCSHCCARLDGLSEHDDSCSTRNEEIRDQAAQTEEENDDLRSMLGTLCGQIIQHLSPAELGDIVQALKVAQQAMTDEERRLFWEELQDPYCSRCGSAHLPCHCENDE